MRERVSESRRLQSALSQRYGQLARAWSAEATADDEHHIDLQQPRVPTDRLSSSSFQHPRELLQQTIWPLSHAPASSSDDLHPHAAPKAKELYSILTKGLPDPPCYMITPDGTARSAWDFLMAIFTTALLIYVPVLIAYYSSAKECAFVSGYTPVSVYEANAPAQTSSGVQFMALTNVAFLLDVVLNFLTGIRQFNPDTGMVEYCYDLRAVARHYLKSWLVLDLVSCLPLECMIIAGGVENSYNLGHLNRLLKVFGLRRRAHGDPFRLIDRLPFISNNFNYSLRLVVVSASVLLMALHYFACALWLVLRVQGFPAHTWPVELHLVDDLDVFEAWTWSVFAVTSAMIGLGYGSYPPQTFPEAVLWTVHMMVMAAGFAIVNGFILSAILEFLASKARYKAKLMQVKHEVQRRRLPMELQQKVLNYFELQHADDYVQDGAVLMSEMPPGLRMEVALAIAGDLFCKLSVFRNNRQLLQQAALLAQGQVVPEGHLISVPGTPHKQLIFIKRGYADLYMLSSAGEVLIDTLVAGDTFGEAALLPVPPFDELPDNVAAMWGSSCFSSRYWPVLFSVRALSNCSLLVLDADAFAQLVQEYSLVHDDSLQLAQCHAQVLSALPELEQRWSAAAAFNPMKDRPVQLMRHGQTQAAAAAAAAAASSSSVNYTGNGVEENGMNTEGVDSHSSQHSSWLMSCMGSWRACCDDGHGDRPPFERGLGRRARIPR